MCTFITQIIHVKQSPLKLTVLPKTFMHTPKATPEQNVWRRRKNMKRCTATEQHASRAAYSQWQANSALCHILVRRGEWMASKHCSLSRCSLPWRADYSPWWFFNPIFTPKTKFSSTPIPNLIGSSTCDDSRTCTSIIHKFYGLSTPLTTKFLPHDLIPQSTKQQQQPVKFSFRIT